MDTELKTELMRFIAGKTDEAVFSPREGYFPFSVIADAFEKGSEHGKEDFKQKLRTIYIKNFEISLDAVIELRVYLEGKGFPISKLYVNHSFLESKALISVPDNFNINKDFIQLAYKKVSELQYSVHNEGASLCIDFIDTSGVNEELISIDGYTFVHDFSKTGE